MLYTHGGGGGPLGDKEQQRGTGDRVGPMSLDVSMSSRLPKSRIPLEGGKKNKEPKNDRNDRNRRVFIDCRPGDAVQYPVAKENK